jgi:hypothetical protein
MKRIVWMLAMAVALVIISHAPSQGRAEENPRCQRSHCITFATCDQKACTRCEANYCTGLTAVE